MRATDAHAHPVTNGNITQNDFRQFIALRSHAQDDPGFEIRRLHQGNLGWQPHHQDLPDFHDFTGERPGLIREHQKQNTQENSVHR
jgi:hypothetical protein